MVTYSLLNRSEINNSPSGSPFTRPLVWIPITTAILLSAAFVFHSSPKSKPVYETYPNAIPFSAAPIKIGLDEFINCNPFGTIGRLLVDIEIPTNIIWKPYDSSCNPSSYLKALYRAPGDTSPLITGADGATTSAEANALREQEDGVNTTRDYLPWLMNKTVLIHGDSIDRFHLKDFCDLVGGNLFNVGTNHPAHPMAYSAAHIVEMGSSGEESDASKERWRLHQEKESFWGSRGIEGQLLTNPWVCDIQEYGFTMINVFTFGLEGAENFFGTERWYHGPGLILASSFEFSRTDVDFQRRIWQD